MIPVLSARRCCWEHCLLRFWSAAVRWLVVTDWMGTLYIHIHIYIYISYIYILYSIWRIFQNRSQQKLTNYSTSTHGDSWISCSKYNQYVSPWQVLILSGWWIQTCFIFHFIYGIILPIDELIICQDCYCTTNQLLFDCFWELWIFQSTNDHDLVPETILVGGLEHLDYFPYIGNNNPNWLSYFSEG